jgi:precorrin-6B methylase 2
MLEWTTSRFLILLALTLIPPVDAPQAPQPAAVQRDEAARETWQRVADIFDAMAVHPGAVVADVGAGGGFLTVRLARAVGPTGRVLAVDVSAGELERLRSRIAREGLTNVETVKGDADNPHLPSASLDAAVIVNAYHEMREYPSMLRQIRSALKPTGRLVIVEPISEKHLPQSRAEQTAVHEIAARFVEQEARESGFRIERLQDPFATRVDNVEWLVVAVPDPVAITMEGTCPIPPKKSPDAVTAPVDEESQLANPDLRMAFEMFKKRRAGGTIVVVDVRSEAEFVAGHIPGATWIPLSTVGSRAAELRARGKPIVTYCS